MNDLKDLIKTLKETYTQKFEDLKRKKEQVEKEK